MRRDSAHNFAAASAIAPGTYTDDPASAVIDRRGFGSLSFALTLGVGGIAFTATNRIDLVMEHSDDGVTFEPVGADNVLGAEVAAGGIVRSQRAAHPALTVYRVGYVDGTIGQRRYVRLRADFNGTHATGTPLAALAVLGHPAIMPTVMSRVG